MDDQKILIVKGKAGLGNRILALLGSMVYADISGRKLVIDWRDPMYSKKGQNSYPVFFETPDVGDPAQYDGEKSVAPPAWSGRLTETVDEMLGKDHPENVEIDNDRAAMANYTADFRRRDYPERVLIRWAWTHELSTVRPAFGPGQKALKGQSDDEILRALIRDRIRLASKVQARIDEFVAANFGGPTIGLHVRYSDRKNPFEHYRNYVDNFLKKRPNGGVFLATDNKDVEKFFRDLYPRVSTAPKWFPPPGVPIHRNLESRDPAEGALEALTDMYLLGRCDSLVVNTTSTFGHVASLLSNAKREDRIDTSPVTWRTRAKGVYLWLNARKLVP